MSDIIRVRRNRELPAMPTTQRTNEFFSLSPHSHSRTTRPLEIFYYYLRGVHSCLKSRIPSYLFIGRCVSYQITWFQSDLIFFFVTLRRFFGLTSTTLTFLVSVEIKNPRRSVPRQPTLEHKRWGCVTYSLYDLPSTRMTILHLSYRVVWFCSLLPGLPGLSSLFPGRDRKTISADRLNAAAMRQGNSPLPTQHKHGVATEVFFGIFRYI